MELLARFIDLTEEFVFYYPLAMSIVWIVGALFFFYRRERRLGTKAPKLTRYPMVSVIVPAHNEQEAIASTIESIMQSDYPNFEVLVVDDGSKDDTPRILRELAVKYDKLRVFILEKNRGKPSALHYGTLASIGEIVMTIDADAYVDVDAMTWLVSHFVTGPRVGAVTGNPRVRNRTSLLAKIQVGEYSSIIGMIKRTQRLLGKVLTVSGVIVAFSKPALYDVGLWDFDMITDDINITWKLEKKFWDIRYEPKALCWILVPESLKGIWNQRVRWAQGGGEVIRRHVGIWTDWRQRRLWPVYMEYVFSVVWAYAYIGLFVLWLVGLVFPIPDSHFRFLPDWKGSLLVFICLLQFGVSLFIDSYYEKGLFRCIFWVIWYPVAYWLITALCTVWATPKALTRKMGGHATWVSPDRGMQQHL
ncbi:biofilm PGA synthesis N-glycosyltransferase PgaC [Sporomusaceae bacterium BoRhaA]|uniref:poly-beta-1,6-N-acetyl-D-glucosamine synthase n=1 Tax=Pelorhabdus rhamnosifermentans TaxID=2772457 RepID=UPI001C063004|nr:poly-beta-1,6-N-acetyl-D-glucosamine synthase [Pelorhabdus rhamnosifermentans]MBU2700474.1 biofilm PGA synthesis N-glycosyltransferase PgaC [Pelorhabdus rhamnosifermentans]